MDNICCIMSLQGFNIGRKFLAREFGWINVEDGKANNVRFNLKPHEKNLTDKDRSTIRFSSSKLHGLPFAPAKNEEVIEHDDLKKKIKEVYDECKTDNKDIVAIKGSVAAKELLEKLKIPFINLEKYGCPKYAELKQYHTESSCKYHKSLPCSISEVTAYRSWLMDHKHEFHNKSDDSENSSDYSDS